MTEEQGLPSYGPESVGYVMSSKMGQDQLTFLWSIKNFSKVATETELLSPKFQGPKTKHTWQLVVKPNERTYGTDMEGLPDLTDPFECIRVFLSLVELGAKGESLPNKVVRASFVISLLDANYKPIKEEAYSCLPILISNTTPGGAKKSKWTINGIIDLIMSTDDALNVHCQLVIQHELEHNVSLGGRKLESEKEATSRRLCQLKQNLEIALKSADFSDVSLVTMTRAFPVHKFMLAARSPVFQAMFRHKMLESSENSVKILDFDAEVVESMLEYIYTGHTEELNEKAPDLLRIANKYQVIGLIGDCADALGDNLKVEEATEILAIANDQNLVELRTKVLDYVSRNKDKLCCEKGFNEFAKANPDVILELFCSIK